MHRAIPLLTVLSLLLAACEKEITVDLPVTEPRLVVEGRIEAGGSPLVILTRTQSYFAPTDLNSIASIFVSGARVVVTDGLTTDTLDQVCSDQIPDSLLEEAGALTGLDPALLASANICVYYDLGGQMTGVEGRSYALTILEDGVPVATSMTSIPHHVDLDSTWFQLALQEPDDDTLGFVWARLTDPDTLGNAYRWYAKRINDNSDGQDKDDSFIAPFFSVFEDRYVNGLTFDFNYNRGSSPYADDTDDPERGYFKVGDTVVVRFASIGQKEYQFFNTYYNNVASQGDLFSNPSNARSNINGGLGVWAGYSYAYDTVVCQP